MALTSTPQTRLTEGTMFACNRLQDSCYQDNTNGTYEDITVCKTTM